MTVLPPYHYHLVSTMTPLNTSMFTVGRVAWLERGFRRCTAVKMQCRHLHACSVIANISVLLRFNLRFAEPKCQNSVSGNQVLFLYVRQPQYYLTLLIARPREGVSVLAALRSPRLARKHAKDMAAAALLCTIEVYCSSRCDHCLCRTRYCRWRYHI